MIDLHCHILPGIDDGSRSLEMSLDMGRMAVDDGIETLASTSHIYRALYMSDTAGIVPAGDALQRSLDDHGISLKLTTGADVHLVPGLVEGIRSGRVPCLHGSRYLLLEPSHHVAPPHFEESVFRLVAEGYVPVITHPERLTWVEDHYEVFGRLVRQGAWMQVTAGALTGTFGSRAKYWGERFLADGLTHILATDAHSSGRRCPNLSQAREIAERAPGREEADLLVRGRPRKILEDAPPSEVAAPPAVAPRRERWWQALLHRRR